METFSGAEIYILTAFFFWFELLQLKDRGWGYLGDVTNIADMSSAIINIVLILKEDYFHEMFYTLETQ